ncbi:coronin-1A-like [Oscarella lobularis]|uniref:coronin-1A-like n=1 Tax=Oscarella lobularis TaxID=121494 RepID=UPI0033135B1B
MSRFVRSSKFRHVNGTAFKRDDSYEGFQVTRSAHDGDFCAVNTKYIAIIPEVAGGGAFFVHPLDKPGRFDTAKYPRVSGHKAAVNDIKWNPFEDDLIASASEDCVVKLWQIPDEGVTETMTESVADLQAHQRKVTHLNWHPTAEFLLASGAADGMAMLWNVAQEEVITEFEHPDNILSMSWSLHGDYLATTCKDKRIRVWDPRKGGDAVSFPGHEGSKASHVVYLNDDNRLFTAGSSRMSERQYAMWDSRKATKPFTIEMIDTSSGVLHPYYDPDTNLMFLAGKGDANIRYYEIVNESPYCFYISTYSSKAAQRGIGILPKRAVNTSKCEVFRMYKLLPTPSCEIVSFTVPRKSDLFQDDLYPPCYSGEPSISIEDFMGGKKAKCMTKKFAGSKGGGGSKKTSSLKKEDHAPKSKIKSKIRDDADEEEEADARGKYSVAKAAPPKEEPVVMTSSADKAEMERLKEAVAKLEMENEQLKEENDTLTKEMAVRDKKIRRLERQLDELDRV